MHDDDYSHETTLLTTTAMDDTRPLTPCKPPRGTRRAATHELGPGHCAKGWPAGYVGLCRYRGGSSVPQCDDVSDGECGHEVGERK